MERLGEGWMVTYFGRKMKNAYFRKRKQQRMTWHRGTLYPVQEMQLKRAGKL